MNIPALALLAAAMAALYPSVDLRMSSSKVWGILLGVSIFFALVNTIRSVAAFWRMLWVLLLVGTTVALLALLGTDWKEGALIYIPAIYDKLPTLIRNVPGSGIPNASDLFNAREVGGTMAMMLPVGVAMALAANSTAARTMAGAAAVFIALVLLLTQSPTAYLGGAVAVLLVLGAWSSRLLLAISLSSALLLLSSVALLWGIAALPPAYPVDGEARALFGLRARLEVWSSGFLMLRDMPFTGVGINTFSLVLDGFYPTASLGPEPHVHNLFLQVALDLGVPGLFAFLWLLVALYASVKLAYERFADKRMRAGVIALGCSVLAYLVFGSIDAITVGAKPGAALWAAIGLLGALSSLPDGPPKAAVNGRPAVLTPVIIALALFAPLAWHVASGGLWLNLGVVGAHKGVIQARDTGAPPVDALAEAENYLARYLGSGNGSFYAYSHLSSVQGWLGKDRAAVESMAQATSRAAAELPIASGPLGLVLGPRDPVDREGSFAEVAFLHNQWTTRFPTRWEAHLMKAQFLHQVMGDAAGAQAALKEGLEKSDLKGPLEQYLQQLTSATNR